MSSGDRGGQLRRMLLLMTLLSSAESPMSAEEIATALECESRTARRDLEILRECGVEVLTIAEGRRVAYSARPLLLMREETCACGCALLVRQPLAELRLVRRSGQERLYATTTCRQRVWRRQHPEWRQRPRVRPRSPRTPLTCRDCRAPLRPSTSRGRPPVRCAACR